MKKVDKEFFDLLDLARFCHFYELSYRELLLSLFAQYTTF